VPGKEEAIQDALQKRGIIPKKKTRQYYRDEAILLSTVLDYFIAKTRKKNTFIKKNSHLYIIGINVILLHTHTVSASILLTIPLNLINYQPLFMNFILISNKKKIILRNKYSYQIVALFIGAAC
jgi:hypothetical protein